MAEGRVDFNREIQWGLIKLVIKDEGLGRGLNSGADKVNREIMARMQYFAPRIEGDMKTSAPWTDRTANARNGLAARAFHDDPEMGIILYHQVPYGIYLETRFSGRYAIVNPSIDKWGPIVLQGLNGTMEKIQF